MYSRSVFQGRNFLKWGRHAWLASAMARGMYEFVLLQIFLRSISIVTTNLNTVDALELLLYFFMLSASVQYSCYEHFSNINGLFTFYVFHWCVSTKRHYFAKLILPKAKQIRPRCHFGFCDFTRVALSTKLGLSDLLQAQICFNRYMR